MDKNNTNGTVQMWAGIECTINRVGDRYRDQLKDAGWYERKEDLEHIASLGVTRLRFPVLWEKHEPVEGQEVNWDWIGSELARIRDLGMEPIAGLLHHGSGPAYTSLLDKDFPTKFASYALKVAKQFPWLSLYTPVNEPLTTARFSGLYGFWYPHESNDKSFLRMLCNQLKGTVLAMQAIRTVNPDAQLVQTEDLAMVHSTEPLKSQASFENLRRWLSLDLLCGKLNQDHPMWRYFMRNGIDEATLQFFLDNPMPPDVIGFNYYVTSERYLDHDRSGYPQHEWASNGRRNYADVAAVRKGRALGVKRLLRQAWRRYGLPIAITECHLCCSREEQLRWLNETWIAANELLAIGVDMRAVTAWAVTGAYDWNSLITQHNNVYETGVFDLSDGTARPTALAGLVKSLALTGSFDHPLLNAKGWWNREGSEGFSPRTDKEVQPLLLAGPDSKLMQAVIEACHTRGICFIRVSSDNPNEIFSAGAVSNTTAWAIIIARDPNDKGPGEQDDKGPGEQDYNGPGTQAAEPDLPVLVLNCLETSPETMRAYIWKEMDLFMDRLINSVAEELVPAEIVATR